jgi:hypothetical protein
MSIPQRLPTVNSDDGQWGDILNQYIGLQHYNTGLDDPLNESHQTITIRPGTTSAGSSPLKFISGPLMTTAEVGAVEFLTDTLYFTQTTSSIRKTIAIYDDTSGATGDIYYKDSTGSFARLPVGSTGQGLVVGSGVPVWAATTNVSFETVSKNLNSYPSTINYTGSVLTSIVYTVGSNSITKTLNYTTGVLTSIVLSGTGLPSGISLTKTLNYTSNNLTSVSYA